MWYSNVLVECVLNVLLCPTLGPGGPALPLGPSSPVSPGGPCEQQQGEREFNYQVFLSVFKAIQTGNQSNKQLINYSTDCNICVLFSSELLRNRSWARPKTWTSISGSNPNRRSNGVFVAKGNEEKQMLVSCTYFKKKTTYFNFLNCNFE